MRDGFVPPQCRMRGEVRSCSLLVHDEVLLDLAVGHLLDYNLEALLRIFHHVDLSVIPPRGELRVAVKDSGAASALDEHGVPEREVRRSRLMRWSAALIILKVG